MTRQQRTLPGREEQLSSLARLLDPGRARLRVAEVVGDPGTGKTRLLAEFAARARAAGVPTITGRATARERGRPFGVFAHAVRDVLSSAAAAGAGEQRTGPTAVPRAQAGPPAPSAGALPAAVVATMRRLVGVPQEAPAVPEVHAAVRGLLEALANPSGLVVVVLDDVHRMDDLSAELLTELFRHPPPGRPALVLAHRPRQTPPERRRLLADAVQDGVADLVELGPLPESVATTLVPPGVSAARRRQVVRDAGGNPFYLRALAREPDSADGGGRYREPRFPPDVQASIRGELAALTAHQRLVAHALAVAGDDADPDLLSRVAQLPVAEVLAVLDGLAPADVIRAAGRGFRFRHAVVRRVAYATTGAGWRLLAHRRAAEVLEERDASAAERADHVARSAPPGDLAAARLLGAASAEAVHTAPEQVVGWLPVALALLPDAPDHREERLDLRILYALVLGLLGRLRESRDALHDLSHQVPSDDIVRTARIAELTALADVLLGRNEEARAVLVAALDVLPDDGAAAWPRLRLAALGGGGAAGGAHAGAGAAAAAAATRSWPAGGPHDGDRRLAAGTLAADAAAALVVGPDAAAERRVDTAADLVDAMSDAELAERLEIGLWLADAEFFAERRTECLRHLHRLVDVAEETGQRHLTSNILSLLGSVHTLTGDLREAAACYDDALEHARATGSETLLSKTLGHQSWKAIWAGRVDEALRLAREAVACADHGRRQIFTVAHGSLALAYLQSGEPQLCIDEMVRVGRGPDLPGVNPVARAGCFRMLAEAETALGRGDRALGWAQRAERHAGPLPRRRGLAHLARAHALSPGDPEAAVRSARSAARELHAAGDRLSTAQAHLLAGQLLAAAEPDAAREDFAVARRTFETCGAQLLLRQAIRAERRMNARRPRGGNRPDLSTTEVLGESGNAQLTTREFQVASLVCQGLTNRQIADELHLSHKTVGIHLGRVYAKLGVSRRAAVAGRLVAQGLVEQGPRRTA